MHVVVRARVSYPTHANFPLRMLVSPSHTLVTSTSTVIKNGVIATVALLISADANNARKIRCNASQMALLFEDCLIRAYACDHERGDLFKV